jgi:protein-S-isoprenylcysteine O-methyltransferase Ste14
VSVWRQGRAIAVLPFTVAGVIPALIVWRTEEAGLGWGLGLPGGALLAAGLLLVAVTIALVARVGGGTLAPWDPTERLVVRGPYRRVRNPMITGVLCVLLGEAALFASVPLLIWAGAVFAVNAVYLPLVEEPGLRRRFGADYDTYRAHVPRWLPRVRPWDPST